MSSQRLTWLKGPLVAVVKGGISKVWEKKENIRGAKEWFKAPKTLPLYSCDRKRCSNFSPARPNYTRNPQSAFNKKIFADRQWTRFPPRFPSLVLQLQTKLIERDVKDADPVALFTIPQDFSEASVKQARRAAVPKDWGSPSPTLLVTPRVRPLIHTKGYPPKKFGTQGRKRVTWPSQKGNVLKISPFFPPLALVSAARVSILAAGPGFVPIIS
ncbi:hypothetical protein C8R47DRAFT_1081868 [Mycena vitilis]|nr:hypothetical protein C8R47DRAFT_1081868 [Mycena vitilis]